jgi:hypothetical protein
MPLGNGTGPGGMGPMTGKAAGFCNGFSTPGYANPVAGCNFFGRGRRNFRDNGRGFNFRNRNFALNNTNGYSQANTNTNNFENQKEYLVNELENIKTQLANLEKTKSEKNF